jgi:hypothetical protein
MHESKPIKIHEFYSLFLIIRNSVRGSGPDISLSILQAPISDSHKYDNESSISMTRKQFFGKLRG